jgi:hypothetical protein
MLLLSNRKWISEDATISDLSIAGEHECFILEDLVRAEGIKIPGATAIPAGEYEVVIDRSDRFSQKASKLAGHPVDVFLPRLLNVQMFSGIRIHSGFRAIDTEGCLITGLTYKRGNAFVGAGRLALGALQPKIQAALDSGEGCRIRIVNAFEALQG